MSDIEKYVVTREQLFQAIKLASEGKSVRKICKELGISIMALSSLQRRDAHFKREFSLAREIGLEVLADDLIDITDTYTNVLEARLVSENTRWLLSKRIPKTYGDRIDVNVNQTISISDAMRDAKTRAGIEARDVIELNASDQTEDTYSDTVEIVDEEDIFS